MRKVIDPDRSRRRILQYIRRPPALKFSGAPRRTLACKQPGLDRPTGLTDWAERSERTHPALVEITELLKHGASKLEYGRTSADEWRRYFRFANDRLREGAGGKTRAEAVPTKGEALRYINASERHAQRWFIDELIPNLDGKAQYSAYVLGEPGAGKSTLLKYLINTNASYLAQKKVVFSRFEFMKFYNRWRDKSKNKKVALEIYISYILLRDIVRTLQYAHKSDGTIQRVDYGYLSNIQIKTTLEQAARLNGEVLDSGLREALAGTALVIEAASSQDELVAPLLSQIDHDIRIMIVNFFAYKFELALVIDGLDCIALEDREFESERAEFMRVISREAQRLTSFSLVKSGAQATRDVPVSTIFVMRENTFYFYDDFVDTRLNAPPPYRVQELDAKLVMYNALMRATDKWAQSKGLSDTLRDRYRHLAWKSAKISLKTIARQLRVDEASWAIEDLFGGNIRTTFTFMKTLLDWFLEDAISTETLELRDTTSTEDIVKLMSGHEGMLLMRRRSYRIVELLLLGRGAWFENAVTKGPRHDPNRGIFDQGAEGLTDNGRFTGFIDNVLNYHIRSHRPHGFDHHLLEKVRIIQLLEGKGLQHRQIQKLLREKIGFEPADLKTTLLILIRAQMLTVQVRSDHEIILSASKRGVMCTKQLMRSMAYLEHTFHRTLFPRGLVRRIRDQIRGTGAEQWAVASIRNLFVFLTYLKFVEESSVDGRPIPFAMRMSKRATDSVVASIERMLSPRARSARYAEVEADARWENIAHRAERLIDNIVHDWEQQGLLDGAYDAP